MPRKKTTVQPESTTFSLEGALSDTSDFNDEPIAFPDAAAPATTPVKGTAVVINIYEGGSLTLYFNL